jgi:LmbE family N-acetylglucosaminyl deacetylase
MCITAHPDDESGGFGGALLLAHAAGAETSVVCLTEGQAATYRGTAQSGEELAQIRRAEFAAASKVLRVSNSEILNYPDGQLHAVSFQELTSVLIERIRARRPQVVLTFGTEGGVNMHRDHIVASLAATAAFQFAGRDNPYPETDSEPYTPQKLYYVCSPFFAPANPSLSETVARTPASLTLELGAWRQTKLEAFLKHETQASVLDRVRKAFDEHGGRERYLLIASRAARPLAEDDGLFSGVIED